MESIRGGTALSKWLSVSLYRDVEPFFYFMEIEMEGLFGLVYKI